MATLVFSMNQSLEGLLTGDLTELGLLDEYRIYLHPVVLGGGDPYFVGPRPRLRLAGVEQVDDDVLRLSYVPAAGWPGPTASGH